MALSRGAQPGNTNGFKGFQFRDALHKALKRYEDKDKGIHRGHALFHICLKLVDKAASGEDFAIKEIADRLDGKPTQAITGPGGEPITLVQRVIVQQGADGRIIEGETVPDQLPDNSESGELLQCTPETE